MKLSRRSAIVGAAALSVSPAVPVQDFPSEPIKIGETETVWWTEHIKAAGIEPE